MNFAKKKVNVFFRNVLLLILFLFFINNLYAQSKQKNVTEFPSGNYWSLDVGAGMSGILVDGLSFQAVIDPKLWLSPPLMVGSKVALNYSAETKTDANKLGNILTIEGQVYMRWNFLRLGKPENVVNIFLQGGVGLIAAYRGESKLLDLTDVTETRGSILADAALGITIPITKRLHIEPQIRGGYPHLWGASLTIGYKFPLPQARIEYVERIRNIPASEIVKIIKINSIEFVLFGPDVGRYNVGIDRDAQQLNELVINYTVQTLNDNPNYRVRIEGHANPFTITVSEAEDLMALSTMRAETIADLLKARGVNEEQIVIVGFGGTRIATSEWDIRNRNRRVELMIIQIDTD